MNQDFEIFLRDVLVPCAGDILRTTYEAYCSGGDIALETKDDFTPASLADRDTEAALRDLIRARYPEHGIWGEEFGAEGMDRDYIWVLDPLDGTKEFLTKNPGCFGALIGLLHKGRPVGGAIFDPLGGALWMPDKGKNAGLKDKALVRAKIACTAPEGMFKAPAMKGGIERVRGLAAEFTTGMNCIGFAKVADGSMDAVIENDLKLHDIAALLPVLQSAGAVVTDLNGHDYFDVALRLGRACDERYGIIAACGPMLAREILEIFTMAEAV